MNAKMNADDLAGAQELSSEELMQVHGGQEEIPAAIVIIGGYLAEKAVDYAYGEFAAWSNTVTHAPYTDSYAQAIDAANQAQTQQEMTAQMDQMSAQGNQGQGDQGNQGGHGDQGGHNNQSGNGGSGDQGGYPSNGGHWEYGGGYGG
jgi:hypothetical protein